MILPSDFHDSHLPLATTFTTPTIVASRRVAYRTLGVTCITLALAYGVWYAYSVFLVALLREFAWSRSVLAGAFSVFTLVQGATNPALGWLSDRWGPRRLILAGGAITGVGLTAVSLITTPWQLYVSFGVVTAVGVAAAGWTPAVVLVQRQFSARLGLALGIAGSGIGLGIFLVVPLCQALIDAWGWRWALRILGALCAGWILPATWLAVRPVPAVVSGSPTDFPPPSRPARPHPAGTAYDLTLAGALATVPFWLIAAAMFLGNVCSQTLHVHQAAFLVDHGLTPMVAASVVSAVGASSIVGKTGGGWLSDVLRREVVYALGIASMIASIVVLRLISIAPTTWLAYAYALLFGVGYSVTASLIPAMVGDWFRGRHFGAIFGVSQIGSALGSALGAWLAGRIFDATGSYGIPFTLAAATGAAAGVAVWIVRTVCVTDRPGLTGWSRKPGAGPERGESHGSPRAGRG